MLLNEKLQIVLEDINYNGKGKAEKFTEEITALDLLEEDDEVRKEKESIKANIEIIIKLKKEELIEFLNNTYEKHLSNYNVLIYSSLFYDKGEKSTFLGFFETLLKKTNIKITKILENEFYEFLLAKGYDENFINKNIDKYVRYLKEELLYNSLDVNGLFFKDFKEKLEFLYKPITIKERRKIKNYGDFEKKRKIARNNMIMFLHHYNLSIGYDSIIKQIHKKIL